MSLEKGFVKWDPGLLGTIWQILICWASTKQKEYSPRGDQVKKQVGQTLCIDGSDHAIIFLPKKNNIH